MAKKSNKTEQVLKLITKEGEETEFESEAVENEIKPEDDDIFDRLCRDENRCLINLTEHMVKDKTEEIMEKLNLCTCPICRLDVVALALNSLPNKFITTDYGRLHLQLEIYKKQYETDVVSAITKACVRVKVSPRHEV